MKIVRFEAHHLANIPIQPPPFRKLPNVEHALILEIETSDGHIGYAMGGYTHPVIVDFLNNHAAALMVGQDATCINRVTARFDRHSVVRFMGRAYLSALGLVDVALWDLRGKALGVPVHKLLGGSRDKVEVYITHGAAYGGAPVYDIEELAAEAKHLAELGNLHLKNTVGRQQVPDPADDYRRMKAMREAVGPNVKLAMDGNARMTVAELFTALMRELGYERFLAHGSDMGAQVVNAVRQYQPDRLLGAHFSNVYWGYPRPSDPTPEEQAFFGRAQGWQFVEGAYAMLHGTKPQTLSYGLNDSPVGLAAWIVEKFKSWSDGDLENVYGLDGLCANLTLYWVTQTLGSSIRLYAESFSDKKLKQPPERGAVPVGVIVFPKDILPAPRAWGERWYNIVHWTEASSGGHFGAWEVPELFVQDLRAFANQVFSRPE
ncbi:mandelate racemase/muconate lactonizing enzyme family protein [Pandoraea pneumonica]|uniref:mandelate racemase/muconate lactonizing enzyme family protein n=1 Tax=Pandoraea pneumonica TaxID=2508299 RepID=UPI003CF7BD10